MSGLYDLSFQPVTGTSEHSFTISVTSTPSLTAIAVTTTRNWQYPTSRTIRFAESDGKDTVVHFSMVTSASVTALAATTDSMLLLGGTAEVVRLQAGQDYISVMCATSTALSLNVTLGTGA